jgi:hypothetical protein
MMGLDITALRRARRVSDKVTEEGYYCYPNSDFLAQADGLLAGPYEAEEIVSFRAGSYSRYNLWRDRLSRMALGVSAETIWGDPERFAGYPFVELINFADNEGIIGPRTSAKLAEDFEGFAKWLPVFVGQYLGDLEELNDDLPPDDYDFLATYQRFGAAFKLAADDGLVDFG